MIICLDTDPVVEFLRGNKKIIREIELRLNNEEPLFITYITLCELFRGAYLSRVPQREVERIKLLLHDFKVLDFTMEASENFGIITAKLQKEGRGINDADALIGCIALAHGCALVTNNTKHFERIPGLKVVNWM